MSVLVIATSVVAIAAPETDCYWCKQSISHPYTKRTANTHHTEINVRRSGFSAKCRVQKSCHKLKSSANIERRMCISITLSRYPRSAAAAAVHAVHDRGMGWVGYALCMANRHIIDCNCVWRCIDYCLLCIIIIITDSWHVAHVDPEPDMHDARRYR